MAKIEVTPITSGYNVAALNQTLQNIEDEFKNKVVYRDEVSPMERALDLNNNDLINGNTIAAKQIQLGSELLVEGSIEKLKQAVNTALDASAYLNSYINEVVMNIQFPLDLGLIADPFIYNTFDLGTI